MGVQQSKAIDVICGELDKLAMCKRGSLQTEFGERQSDLSREGYKLKEPMLEVKDRKKVFSKNRKKLLAILKYRPSEKLCHYNGSYYNGRSVAKDLHTTESIRKYNKACIDILKHPKHDAWLVATKKNKERGRILTQEIDQRTSILDTEFKQAKMNFISEEVATRDFQGIFDKLEVTVW